MTWVDGGAISQIVLTLFTIVSVLIAYLAYRDGKQRKKVEMAVSLVHYYQDKIISKISFINVVLEKTSVEDLMKRSFPRNRIKDFDQEELISLSEKADIINLVDDAITKIPIQHILFARIVFEDGLKQVSKLDCFLSTDNPEESKKAFEMLVLDDFVSEISELLNILEWFSMNFVQGIADEKSVYQSLHQSFISIVHSLYYFISKNNTQSCDKYYTNLIKLYNTWSKQKYESAQKEEKIKKQAKDKVRKASQGHKSL